MARSRFRRARTRLREKITFQRVGVQTNAFNEATDWGDLFETRANVTPAPGTEKFANAQNAASAPALFEVRSEARTKAVLPSDRIFRHKDGKTYGILSFDQPASDSNIIIAAVTDSQKGVQGDG